MIITIPVTFVWIMSMMISGLIGFIIGLVVKIYFEDDTYSPEGWK